MHNSANLSLLSDTIFEPIQVIAEFLSPSLSSMPLFTDILSRISTAFSAAFLNPSVITVGWIFCSRSFLALFNNSPVRITDVVVPSPTSES